MAKHNELGKEGEQLAENFLLQKDFAILHRNWRYSHYEIDIVALKNNILHFVEVKSRSSQNFSMPEESVGKKKTRSILKAADEFLFLHPEYNDFHIDILSIIIKISGDPEFFFIEDIYF
jgi:putative endonuclease